MELDAGTTLASFLLFKDHLQPTGKRRTSLDNTNQSPGSKEDRLQMHDEEEQEEWGKEEEWGEEEWGEEEEDEEGGEEMVYQLPEFVDQDLRDDSSPRSRPLSNSLHVTHTHTNCDTRVHLDAEFETLTHVTLQRDMTGLPYGTRDMSRLIDVMSTRDMTRLRTMSMGALFNLVIHCLPSHVLLPQTKPQAKSQTNSQTNPPQTSPLETNRLEANVFSSSFNPEAFTTVPAPAGIC